MDVQDATENVFMGKAESSKFQDFTIRWDYSDLFT